MQKTLLSVLQGKKTDKIPLWFMRQAGRYLPEYRALKAHHNTLEMFKSPKIATEITLQPLQRFSHIDAAIVYADILLIPDAMGLELSFLEKQGPVFSKTIKNLVDLEYVQNSIADLTSFLKKLDYVQQTIIAVKQKLPSHLTMLGFAGAPFTVASYMIEGQSVRGDFSKTKKLMFQQPQLFHELMQCLVKATIAYIKMQITAGAEAIQLFESWSGAINSEFYHEFCFPYVKKIIEEVKKVSPIILFLGQGALLTEQVIALNPTAYSVDWRQDLAKVTKDFDGSNIVLQGNLDPFLLFAPKDLLKIKVAECIKIGQSYKHGYIFNLGHGLQPDTPVENVAFVSSLVAKE